MVAVVVVVVVVVNWSQKEWAMGVEPSAPFWPPPLLGMLPLLGTLRRNRQMRLTLENLMRQAVMTKETKARLMPSLGARRLEQDAVLEFDVAKPETLEPDVARCIHEADKVEGLNLMSKAMSRGYPVAQEGRCDDDTLADVLLIFLKMAR